MSEGWSLETGVGGQHAVSWRNQNWRSQVTCEGILPLRRTDEVWLEEQMSARKKSSFLVLRWVKFYHLSIMLMAVIQQRGSGAEERTINPYCLDRCGELP